MGSQPSIGNNIGQTKQAWCPLANWPLPRRVALTVTAHFCPCNGSRIDRFLLLWFCPDFRDHAERRWKILEERYDITIFCYRQQLKPRVRRFRLVNE